MPDHLDDRLKRAGLNFDIKGLFSEKHQQVTDEIPAQELEVGDEEIAID